MQVASLDLCKQLFELSGWGDCAFVYEDGETIALYGTPNQNMPITPAYDLGYLLRKLPETVESKDLVIRIRGGTWVFAYGKSRFIFTADTPEDACAKLAIELIKQGILKKED